MIKLYFALITILKTHYGKVQETAYKEALAALKSERRRALTEGDADRFEQLDDDIKLKEISDKIIFGRDRTYLTTTKEKPVKPHIYISRVWVRYSPDKPDGGGSHIFKISDEPQVGDDGSGKYIVIPDGITKSLLIWVLSRSEVMRFITKIYAGAMNVPAFIWDIIPFIPVKSDSDSEVYKLLHLNASDIKIITENLNDNIQADDEPVEGGKRFAKTRKHRKN
jgi:hypothetical protein